MFDRQQKLEISPDETAVIEAALHTQSKILAVQAGTGSRSARQRLNEVKRVLARIEASKPAAVAPSCRPRIGWFSRSGLPG
jgi:hypothetical protein